MGFQYERIGGRYTLLQPLGSGGMATVYHAYDRLTDQAVALKRIDLVGQPQLSGGGLDEACQALTREFNILARLRHPYIIAVRDYGFDDRDLPYFTMDLVLDSQNLLKASAGKPLKTKFNYLLQLLIAVEYMHRHGILHRDLKPENITVQADQVRVIDFGLSIYRHDADSAAQGTLYYMPPEAFEGAPATASSDLFAVGIIAYQLLAGRHPFAQVSLLDYVEELSTSTLDLTPIHNLPEVDGEAIATVLAQLLAKDPNVRASHAGPVVDALLAATGVEAAPTDQASIRINYLQNTQFVGREAEMAILNSALQRAKQSNGGIWLLAGEAGVGKSRLCEELRVLALTEGMHVVYGNAVEGIGLPYQLWRGVLRHLLLTTAINDHDASTLKQIVPDIERLLERSIPDPPPLNPQQVADRIAQTIVTVLNRQRQPLLFIAEDIQWLNESLDPIRLLMPLIESLPIIIVANYTPAISNYIPSQFPSANRMSLACFDTETVLRLCRAMLGDSEQLAEIAAIAKHETHGNAYFLVEKFRLLAEQLGSDGTTKGLNLSAGLIAMGLDELLQQRIARVPAHFQSILLQAAVLGSYIDVSVLQAMTPDANLLACLQTCAVIGMVEHYNGRWRFTQSKLRERLLANASVEMLMTLHRDAALAIAEVYPNHPELYPIISDHWHDAGNVDQQVRYAVLSVRHARETGGQLSGIAVGQRTLGQLPPNDRRAATLLGELAGIFALQTQYATAQKYLDDQLSIAYLHNDEAMKADALSGYGHVLVLLGQWLEGRSCLELAIDMAQTQQNHLLLAEAMHTMGVICVELGDFDKGFDYLNEAEIHYAVMNDAYGSAVLLSDRAICHASAGRYEHVIETLDAAAAAAQLINAPHLQLLVKLNRAQLAIDRQDIGMAKDLLQTLLDELQPLHDGRLLMECYLLWAHIHLLQQDLEGAQNWLTRSEQMLADHDAEHDRARIRLYQGQIAVAKRDYAMARLHVERALRQFEASGSALWQAIGRNRLSEILLYQQDYIAAESTIIGSIRLSRQIEHPEHLVEAVAYLLYCIQQNQQQAKVYPTAKLDESLRQTTQQCIHAQLIYKQHILDTVQRLLPELSQLTTLDLLANRPFANLLAAVDRFLAAYDIVQTIVN